jgi:GABA(A) receptor-associated protein
MYVPFKKKYPLEKRRRESSRIMKKYSSRVPVICERAGTTDVPLIDKHKYLVPNDLSMAQFIFVIRRRLKLDASKAIFLFVNKNIIPSNSASLGELYEEYKSKDNFLYMTYSGENTFG